MEKFYRALWHIGSTLTIYCTLVGIRACDTSNPGEYHTFHPYIFCSLLGTNLTILAITELSKKHDWRF